MTKTLLALILLGFAVALSSCRADNSNVDATEPSETADASATEASSVEYEPAYPSAVSGEKLSSEDIAQQETHSHGDGEEHAHDDDTAHSHDDEDHAHGEKGRDDEHEH